MRILIADDDAMIRDVLKEELTDAGHQVFEAEDGESAWAMLQEHALRFIISDWSMPKLEGPELIQRIRAADLPHYTYCILLTSRNSHEALVHGLESGADDYLVKPCDLDELRARVAIGERTVTLEKRLRQALHRLQLLASRDALTGQFNRQAIMKLAKKELLRAQRTDKPISIALLDLDYFKEVNDEHGHLIGDQALRLAAETMAGAIRSYDSLGRWGGEEFLMVLPDANRAHATAIAERVRERLAACRLLLKDGRTLSLRVSVGVAEASPEQPTSLRTLLQHADEALYQAKREGRNRVCSVA
ncbi:MAG: diguanylate cyclase [Ardenticatenales bacterium]|nr:diguanylate cyclase [Ardenticatenales bacterium]